MRLALIFLVFFILNACTDDVVVKPAAELRLEYGLVAYDSLLTECPFQFQKNKLATMIEKENCNINLEYPRMNATLYLSYQRVTDDNLNKLLSDAQKLTYDHTVKANEILEQPRVDPENKVYGMFYSINGDAATQSQFYVTDSIKHFLSGALYFESKPNFDSIYPAVVYLRNDIRRIMESIEWGE